MTLNTFIPTIWSTSLLVNLHKAHVYGQPGVTNTDYEGEISGAGDTVKIHSIGAVTVFDYVKNTDMPAPEVLTDAEQSLVIDQSKAFNFQIDDIDRRQQTPKLMNAATREAAYALADVSDQFLAGLYTTATTQIGSTTAPIVFTAADNAYDQIVAMGVALDEQNITSQARTVVVPPWFYGEIEKDSRFVANSEAAHATLINGFAGVANGVNVVKSNNVPVVNSGAGGTPANTDTFKVELSTQEARTFAEQIVETEAYRPQARFADALKGLHVYGGKIVRPQAMAVLHVTRYTGA